MIFLIPHPFEKGSIFGKDKSLEHLKTLQGISVHYNFVKEMNGGFLQLEREYISIWFTFIL